MNYRLRNSVQLLEKNGDFYLYSHKPLAMLRINKKLADLLGKEVAGDTDTLHTENERIVLQQLVAKGYVEQTGTPLLKLENLPDVTIIIPVMNRAEELKRCLDSISAVSYPKDKLKVIVVDDGSIDDSPNVASQLGSTVISSGGLGRGPAAARNAGAKVAKGEILAFIDSDCVASKNWLLDLMPAFFDLKVAAVGGKVDGLCSKSPIDRYEAVMSSLSIGKSKRTAGSGQDTFYLPSCNLLVRRLAFNNVGGFEESMHVGEDVDMTWRLRDSGWHISYLPCGNIRHEHRSSVRSFMSRRFDYGTSEGILQLRHPKRSKEMLIPPLLALVLFLCLLMPFAGIWSFLLALGTLSADIVYFWQRCKNRSMTINLYQISAARLKALASLAYYSSYHLVRYYVLLLIVIGLIAPTIWSWLMPTFIFLIATAVDYFIKKPELSLPVFCCVYLLEQIAYSCGVVWGCVSRKNFGSYRINLLKQPTTVAG